MGGASAKTRVNVCRGHYEDEKVGLTPDAAAGIKTPMENLPAFLIVRVIKAFRDAPGAAIFLITKYQPPRRCIKNIPRCARRYEVMK